MEANTGYPIPQLSVASLRSRSRGPCDHDGVDGLITMDGMRSGDFDDQELELK